MSTVFLHVGQCGNQLGQAFWEEASSPRWSVPGGGSAYSKGTAATGKSLSLKTPSPSPVASSSASSSSASSSASQRPTASTKVRVAPALGYVPYTLVDGSIPCVLVDTEPKVIRRCLDKKRGGSLVLSQRVREEYCISDKTGRGNNWAYGYYGRKGERDSGSGEPLLGRVCEAVRKVVERCDRFSGFLMLHSIAGGTGSGLGSALLEALRDDYPLAFIMTATITPFSQGETPLQHYNSLLSLSWLQSYADAVLLFENDSLLQQVQKDLCGQLGGGGRDRASERKPGGDNAGALSVNEMNSHISGVLCNALMPLWKDKQRMPNLSFQEPWELIRSVCPDPRTKFITASHVCLPRSTSSSWDQVKTLLLRQSADSLRRQRRRRVDDGVITTKALTSSLAFIARGSPLNVAQLIGGLQPLETKLKKAYNTVSWNPFPVDYWMSYEPSMGQVKMASVLANSSVVLDYVEGVRESAKVMFDEGAYLHWYKRYGCEKERFESAFESVQGIIDSYSSF